MCRENLGYHDSFLDGNEKITTAIDAYYANSNPDNRNAVLGMIRKRMQEGGHLLFPVLTDEEDDRSFTLRAVQTDDGNLWLAAFTSQEEYEKGEPSGVLSNFIDTTLKACLNTDAAGFMINPWGQPFLLDRECIERIFREEDDSFGF